MKTIKKEIKMRLSKLEKDSIIEVLYDDADGEDIQEILTESGFSDQMLRQLVMSASMESVQALLEEKQSLLENSRSSNVIYKDVPSTMEEYAASQLSKYGAIYVNYWSTDCDGCSSAGYTSFSTVSAFIDWIDSSNEWCDGSWGWEFTTSDNLITAGPAGYWGM